MNDFHTSRGRPTPRASGAQFGKDIADFPKGTNWESPFANADREEVVTLADSTKVTYYRPASWSSVSNRGQESIRAAFISPETNASLVISAGTLPAGQSLESIAAQPFLKLLHLGAKAPIVVKIPITTPEGLSGAMINAPLMVPGKLCARPELAELAMFKHTVVIGHGDHWFSFETQSWGTDLDIQREVAAQSSLYLRLRVTQTQ